jgi:hypothetical protein
MKKIYSILLIVYTLLVQLASLLTLVFLGVLADENIKFEKFEKVYFLGLGYNYDWLYYIFALLIIVTTMVQLYWLSKYLKKVQNKT